MRTVKVLFQQCCNYGEISEYILSQFTVDWNNRNRKQKQGARVEISLKYQSIMKRVLTAVNTPMCQILEYIGITLK